MQSAPGFLVTVGGSFGVAFSIYSNLAGRNDWRAGVLRTGNEFLTNEEGFFFERDTGVLFGMTHPIDRFRSSSWQLWRPIHTCAPRVPTSPARPRKSG